MDTFRCSTSNIYLSSLQLAKQLLNLDVVRGCSFVSSLQLQLA